ncbi:transcription repressor OFP13-like [Olea europaea var. sylvestris]|uniref:Transcription repressor n=1 Tax=Olea europaea subsp. europaea TaxID=158383 RepID=A0A8S0SDW7_OLEEU|nr:transcription repressor OFP13-like [Olea europaea var. sylvestris]CAA2989487.1 transcription repressor OFP13 [Olea europaea subsp. europaea]
MKLIPSIFKNKEANKQTWEWPSCKQPKTLSFRAGDDIFKTVNSVFLDPSNGVETPESWFTNSSECASFSTESEENSGGDLSVETIIRGVRSESSRLLFKPAGDTSSILDEAKTTNKEVLPFKESVVLAMESDDPYLDFKKSMQEMVDTHGLKDWECLEELLKWYLRMNGEMNHRFIVGAFVDLLIEIASSSSDSTSYSSAASDFSSPSSPLSPALGQMAIHEEDDTINVQT